MMKIIFLVMLPLAWSYGEPNLQGGGGFAYADSSGHRGGFLRGARVKRFAFTNVPSLPIPPFPMPRFGSNSAFASAAAGPGFQHQVASIFPSNPAVPNVNHFADTAPTGRNGFYSVSSNSYSSSSNVNGKEMNSRGAETIVNDNGKVTHFKVAN